MRKFLIIYFLATSSLWGFSSISFAPAVKSALPSVVAISAERPMDNESVHPLLQDPFFRHFFEDNSRQYRDQGPDDNMKRSLGSGVIVSKEGFILTNYHVVRDATNILVQLTDDREFSAKLIGVDPDSDLAVLQLENAYSLPVAVIGDDQMLQIGDIVLAIGNPFGVGQTVTQGIVSAMKRKNLGLSLFESYIQTDAAINPGNSGGPLVDVDGNVVGINTAIISSSGGNNGIGFAVPIGFAQQVMNELIADGHVTRGWLGIYMADLNEEIKKSIKFEGKSGVLITGIARSSPAAQSGLRPGDVILSIGDQKINSSGDVSNIVLGLKPDSKVEVEVSRDNQEIVFSVVIGIRHKSNKS